MKQEREPNLLIMKTRKVKSNEIIKDTNGNEVYANAGWYIFDGEQLADEKRYKRKFIAQANIYKMEGFSTEQAYEMAM